MGTKDKKQKIKERKSFKGKNVVDDDSTGRVIRIVSSVTLSDSVLDQHINKIKVKHA